MLFLRGYNKTHPTKFRNYSLPKIYRHRKKKKTAACNSNGWPKLQVFSVGLNIIIILSAIK